MSAVFSGLFTAEGGGGGGGFRSQEMNPHYCSERVGDVEFFVWPVWKHM